jgi:deoxycytidylate deaminase
MDELDAVVDNPELVFGLVGPIGVDLDHVMNTLKSALQQVSYDTRVIHITSLMRDFFSDIAINESSYSARYDSLIGEADNVRRRLGSQAALAGLSVVGIQRQRREIVRASTDEQVSPAFGTAYIVRQFKRPEEIALMRQIYGRKFVQVSVYLDREERQRNIEKKIRNYRSDNIDASEATKLAIDLIDKDYKEGEDEYGQRISDVFHLGDVFVRGDGSAEATKTIERFVQALFGHNGISPTKSEYGMYAAAGAALRSLDLSRQVGAAIFSPAGEVVALGCNEVPKAFGGTYWSDDDQPLHRDYEEGLDGNHHRKVKVLHDLIERLDEIDCFSTEFKLRGDVSARVNHLLDQKQISESKFMDLIEFGRMIHAEMSAISDAARLGRPVHGAILYCTTFPCHICAKHIVSSGLNRVVFLEPYPKSHAIDFHGDAITYNDTKFRDKVLFEPFIGISPRRYRDIFEKGKRKDASGIARMWYEGKPVPRVEDRSGGYLENEDAAIALVAPPKA